MHAQACRNVSRVSPSSPHYVRAFDTGRSASRFSKWSKSVAFIPAACDAIPASTRSDTHPSPAARTGTTSIPPCGGTAASAAGCGTLRSGAAVYGGYGSMSRYRTPRRCVVSRRYIRHAFTCQQLRSDPANAPPLWPHMRPLRLPIENANSTSRRQPRHNRSTSRGRGSAIRSRRTDHIGPRRTCPKQRAENRRDHQKRVLHLKYSPPDRHDARREHLGQAADLD